MKTCPYCHSKHVHLLECRQPSKKLPTTTLSPMSFVTIGSQMSKRINVHPVIGGLVGLVIGGVALLYVQHQNNMRIFHYRCEQCQEYFQIQQSC